MAERTCRGCGCTERCACFNEADGPCWWVEADLCSHCQSATTSLQQEVSASIDPVRLAHHHAHQLAKMLAWSSCEMALVRSGVVGLAERLSRRSAGE